MTEAEWLASTDPRAMLAFREGKTSERNPRCFGCAGGARVAAMFADPGLGGAGGGLGGCGGVGRWGGWARRGGATAA